MNQKKATKEDFFKKLDEAIGDLSDERSAGLKRIKKFQKLRNGSLERERVRLVKKYGKGHSRVKKIDARLKYNQAFFKGLDFEIRRAKTKVPKFNPNSWRVHGQVWDQDLNNLQGLTVSLFDENGRWVEEFGYACTDENGYYVIDVFPEAGINQKTALEQPLFLTVSNADNLIIHQQSKPLSVIVGHIDPKQIWITKQSCNTPPPTPSGPKPSESVPPQG